MSDYCGVNCNEGRKLGCKSYCCRLLIRLTTDEMQPSNDGSISKGFIDKDIDGFCIHFNRNNYNCAIWKNRPQICKAYDCNTDILLQVAINKSFNNIIDLVNTVNVFDLEKEKYTYVPYTKKS